MACQHPDGAFGGGPGQAPHVLQTYAAVGALASVGRAGPGGGWDQIDRYTNSSSPLNNEMAPSSSRITPKSMSEELTVFSALPRSALGEAHGGYTFCALASWVMLRPLLPLLSSSGTNPQNKPAINTRNLVRWLVQMQGSEAELGGFRGRMNKLVDACYSWWVGGAFNLLRPLEVGTRSSAGVPNTSPPDTKSSKGEGKEDEDAWTDDDGLASAQHNVFQVDETREKLRAVWKPKEGDDLALDEFHKTVFAEARAWTEENGGSNYVNGKVDRVNATHPIFNLTITHVELTMDHFYAQE
ncbi:terpenoid cyclases/Protein prenyltransferase [Rickenella mellea]|uniref:Terpenoid cyclases/Protein prenyltransferase n=1 Tax=Rickenella mellea TaxID=50990 RepID=A0A4Y7PS60_9AGAM|nr:terpenoid cyclases/Protein prenyltransferase [Rickenella mellea]